MDKHKLSFEIAELIFQHIKNEISPANMEKLQKWLDAKPENIELFNQIKDEESIKNKINKYRTYTPDKAWKKISKETVHLQNKTKSIRLKILKYAAAILFPLVIGYLFHRLYFPGNDNKQITSIPQIPPGTQKALLIFNNGEKINLGNVSTKKVFAIKSSRITDTSNTLIYQSEPNVEIENNDEEEYNTLQTPIGGEYNLVLADGTKIWLNAASELKYPVLFDRKNRKVFLKGEAYFEVAENKNKPFVVNINEMKITVLGTKFNIMAYHNEKNIKTTLVSGSVRIETISKNKNNEEVYLQPGYQAVLDKESQQLKVNEVDTKIYTAWINGKFVFNNETLDEIMRKLERWYDFKTYFYDKKTMNYHFSGTLKRYENISNILEMIELTTKITFNIQNDTIRVMKK